MKQTPEATFWVQTKYWKGTARTVTKDYEGHNRFRNSIGLSQVGDVFGFLQEDITKYRSDFKTSYLISTAKQAYL